MRSLFLLNAALAISMSSSRAQWLLEGHLLEANGNAPRMGHVVLRHPSNEKVVQKVRVDSQGGFSMVVDSTGVLVARFSAVDHKPSEVILYGVHGQPIHVEVRLSTNACPDSIGGVGVIGGFNQFKFESQLPMKKGEDGIYRLVVPSDSAHFTYQLIGTVPDGRSVNGQQSISYELDGGGDYVSIVFPDHGKVSLWFDPSLARTATPPAHVEIRSADQGSECIMDAFRLRDEALGYFSLQLDSVRRIGKSTSLFRDDYDWHAAQWPLTARLARESDPACRQAILVSLFCSGRMDARDSLVARQLLTEVPPESPLWSLNPSACIENVRLSLSALATEQYVMEVIERNRDPEVKAEFLLEALMVARVEGIGKERARSNFARLTMDYSASKAAELARMYLTPSKRVKVGEKLPAFRFRDVRDSSRYVRNATFRGKVFLMDFWATSCPPCVAEMPALHRVYDTYRPRGFDIISVSIGDISTNLFAFFRTRDSMPWTNVLLADEERAAVMETFELQGVPWPILVDSGGKIIALHSEVRGENLELTVRKALGLPKR